MEEHSKIIEQTKQHLIIFRGFQIPMLPSPRPPARSPREYSSETDPGGLPHDRRLNRSALGQAPARARSWASDWKSSLKISRVAVELKERSTEPAIVPAAR